MKRPSGIAILEVVLSLAAMVPLAVLFLSIVWNTVRLYHLHVGYVAGSPLL